MASRRDELNAYTFAKRRSVAAFLQPSATGTEEGAPRPLRAVVPGLVVGALVLVGFGAWGMFKPQAPKEWDKPGTKVIIGKNSTTRYVVLNTDGKPRLHPVLNLSSARLLLDPGKFDVIQVDDRILDAGKPPRGPIIGIPYAPDRLPSAKDAGEAKRWAVCQQPGGNGKGVQTAAFVLAAREAGLMDDKRKLADGQVLYVQAKLRRPDGGEATTRYLVDSTGTKYKFPEGTPEAATLTMALVGTGTPQQVTPQWLETLNTGEDLAFPKLDGKAGDDAKVQGLTTADNKIGMVLLARTGSGPQHFVVQAGKVSRVSSFTAWLLINSPAAERLNMNGRAKEVDLQSIRPDGTQFNEKKRWPRTQSSQVNGSTGAAAAGAAQGGPRNTVCTVLRSVDGQGRTTLSTWAGTGFPVDISASGTSSYVTPGSGLLYTQFQGKQAKGGGSLFLVTDTGLRYAVQANGDSDAEQSGIGASPQPGTGDGKGKAEAAPEASQAQARLGYKDVAPALVPITWSEFLSKGPRLDTNAARQPQGS
ncbi:type VII secretion protein EccB [Streptomyces sp. NPDC089799]|uniref:type VII secretion protein EccB n=1 Tax=Streptomyces sp. NPDC089799 TaxID=3155066 RepID=UPI0034406F94